MAAHDITDAVDVKGRYAVAAVDFHSTRLYAIDSAPESSPERIGAFDPKGFMHNVYHRDGNPDGTYENDNPVYWRTIAHALKGARGVLLLGHGTGKANASHLLVAYLEKHESDIAATIVADVRVDIDDLTDEQVYRLGQRYFDALPARDHGDSQRGA